MLTLMRWKARLTSAVVLLLVGGALMTQAVATPVKGPAANETQAGPSEPAVEYPALAGEPKTDEGHGGLRLDKETLLLLASVYILVLAGFLGFEVIGRVSPLLHTPLMSATNAISGISLVGSLIAAGNPRLGTTSNVLGFIAVLAATINVVGGFMITDRMLKMFKLKAPK